MDQTCPANSEDCKHFPRGTAFSFANHTPNKKAVKPHQQASCSGGNTVSGMQTKDQTCLHLCLPKIQMPGLSPGILFLGVHALLRGDDCCS